MKRLGPELKMPKFKGGETKVPPFLADLYYDVRDRRLLPVILLILVAIVAAPVLLKDEPEEVPPPPAKSPGIAQTSAKTLTVVKSSPGLRDYKERLRHESPTNPFKQRYTGPVLKGSELNEATSTTSTVEEGSSGGSEGSSGGGTVTTTTHHRLVFFTFAVNVRIVKATTKPDGTVEQSEPEDREKVMPPAPLPGAKAPVVTYLGLGDKEHLPLFMISDEVSAVFGENKCVSGTTHCQLIELKPGYPEIFEYGENNARYKINVLKIVPVVRHES